MVGIICPSPFEYKFLSHSKILKKEAVLLRSGMGKVRSLYGCYRLLKKHPGLHFILLTGFAGALTDSLQIGDVIEPSVFIEEDYNAEPFEKFPNTVRRRARRRILTDSLDAAILTQDRFIKTNPYRHGPYARKYRRVACDMESYAVAYFCEKEKIPYRVIKIISDTADHNAEHDFVKACEMLSPKLNRTILEAVEYAHRHRAGRHGK